jgi:hypothetical protein
MHRASATAVITYGRKLLAMNREEGIHGSQGEEIEIEEESQEECGEEEIRRAPLRSEKKGRRKKEKGRTEESRGEEEIRSEEGCSEKAGSACHAASARTCGGTGHASKPGHLPPVQPPGGRRQSG